MDEVVSEVLGSSYEIAATAVVKLYLSNDVSWEFTNVMGPVSITTNTEDKTHYIHVLNYADKSIALSQELYENFSYESGKAFFHTFEMDDCIAGLSFADEQEATSFMQAVKSCAASLASINPSKHVPPTTASTNPIPVAVSTTPPVTPPATPTAPKPTRPAQPPPDRPTDKPPTPAATTPLPPQKPAHPPPSPAQAPATKASPPEEHHSIPPPTNTPAPVESQAASAHAPPKKEASKRSLFKRLVSSVSSALGDNDAPEGFVVSDPHSFRHESHIGWNTDSGFEIRNIPTEWRKLFQAAGVKKSELKDANTVKYVMEVITESLSGAEPKETPAHDPPPPPTSKGAPPPPPPPGPPPPPSSRPPPPTPPKKPDAAKPSAPASGGRDDLLKSIQLGTQLKSTVGLPDLKNLNTAQSNTLVSTLSSAMLQRRVAMQDEDEEPQEEDEWSD